MLGQHRVVRYTVGGIVGAVALVGVLHLPVARGVMTLFAGLCPVNNVSAEAVEAAQASASARLRGTELAPSRDTLGLRVLFGGRNALDAWIASSASAAGCERQTRGFGYVSCESVETATGERQLLVSYDRAGQVRSVDLISHHESAASAARAVATIADDLVHRLGPPHAHDGQFASEYLGQAFRTSSSSYRFADALVTVRATNIPGSGVVVEERYVAPGEPTDAPAPLTASGL